MKKRFPVNVSLKHFLIIVAIIISLALDDIVCQRGKRPTPKRLLQHYPKTHVENTRSKILPINLFKSAKTPTSLKWKKSSLNKKTGKITKVKLPLSQKLVPPLQSNQRQRSSHASKRLPQRPPPRIIKKSGPFSSGRSKKYRHTNRGQTKSSSLRSQSYSSLPTGSFTNRRQQQLETDNPRIRRKLDVINEWIDRIKDSTKHHSLSPSYTTQSRIQPIPVSSLPLQNERVDTFKGHKINNHIFQPSHLKKQRFNKGFNRKIPSRSAKPKKGQKKQGIWPTKLNFGFFNNKKKSKRTNPKKNKPFLQASNRPSFTKPSLEPLHNNHPQRVGDSINNGKKLKNRPLSNNFKNSFATTTNDHHPSSPLSKNVFEVDPTFSPFAPPSFFSNGNDFSLRGETSPSRDSSNRNSPKRKKFGSQFGGGNKFGLNWRPNDVPLQFTPTVSSSEGYAKNEFRGHNKEDDDIMGNPLSRYRPMPMEEPMDIDNFNVPTKKFFNNQMKSYKRKEESRTKRKNVFPSFSIGDDQEDEEVISLERFPNFPNKRRPSRPAKRRDASHKPIHKTNTDRSKGATTPRPIPIPGKDFAFVIPHRVPSPPHPKQPALPVVTRPPLHDVSNYDYQDRQYDDYDDDLDSFNEGEQFSPSIGFMNAGFGPSWEPSKLSKRRKRSTAAAQEGRSAASSIFWHNGQPIQPRNRNRNNRRRNRQHVWGDRNTSEDEEGYQSGRGGVRDGYGNSGGQSSADFWDDFNINDPQSVYADKYSEQEEIGGGNYRRPHNQYKRPAVESSWGQRQRPLTRNRGGSVRNQGNKYHRDPYPQQSIQDRYPGSGKERYGNEFYNTNDPSVYLEEHNEVLGSGNFDVIQGGTFYDGGEAYYDEYDYNQRPQRYDGENNIENNFRDFADIKNDLLKYDQGYLPRYKKK